MLYLSIKQTSTEIDFLIMYSSFLGLWTRVRVSTMMYFQDLKILI